MRPATYPIGAKDVVLLKRYSGFRHLCSVHVTLPSPQSPFIVLAQWRSWSLEGLTAELAEFGISDIIVTTGNFSS